MPGPPGIDVTIRSDAMWVRTETGRAIQLAPSESDVLRFRLLIEGSRDFAVGGGTLTPSLELGLRRDAGDAETGTGIDAGAGGRAGRSRRVRRWGSRRRRVARPDAARLSGSPRAGEAPGAGQAAARCGAISARCSISPAALSCRMAWRWSSSMRASASARLVQSQPNPVPSVP